MKVKMVFSVTTVVEVDEERWKDDPSEIMAEVLERVGEGTESMEHFPGIELVEFCLENYGPYTPEIEETI